MKHGVYSKILPVKFHELLENVKPEVITNLVHEQIRLKTLLMELAEVWETEIDIDIDKNDDPIQHKLSHLTIQEKIDYTVKIIGVIGKNAIIIEAIRERESKREGYGQEFLNFIKPIVDAFYEELGKIVRDERISREDFPEVHKERMQNREDFS